MHSNPQETQLGTQWFIGSLIVALCFAGFLYYCDQRLSNSPRDRILGQTLLELRTAQTSLPGNISDSRLADHGVSHQDQD